jgi:hypothetical protein
MHSLQSKRSHFKKRSRAARARKNELALRLRIPRASVMMDAGGISDQ